MMGLSFGKTKVAIAMNIFHEKNVFQNLKGFDAASIFVKAVTTLWDSRNVKTRDTRFLLNDENGKPFKSADDKKLKSFLQLPKKN